MVARSWRGNARAALTMIDRHREVCPQGGRVVLHDGVEIEPPADFGQERHAELPAAVEHEIDDFGRDLFGGADEIALIFAVFGVHGDDDFAATDGVNRRFNAR